MRRSGGKSDLGQARTKQEDYIKSSYIDDKEKFFFCGIGDGSGSFNKEISPAAFALFEIEEHLKRIYAYDSVIFENNVQFFLQESFQVANRIMKTLPLGNSELYSGICCSITCLILNEETGEFVFAHCGNTRLYLLRKNKDGIHTIKQLTKDTTEAQKLVDIGEIIPDDYYFHPKNRTLTSCLGHFDEPFVQTFSSSFKNDDVILLTTDGIHNYIKPEFLMQLVLNSESAVDAASNLILGAHQEKSMDNTSAFILEYRTE